MKEKVITISAQIPLELEESLMKLCKLEERSKSYFIKKALENLIQSKLKNEYGFIENQKKIANS